MVLELVNLDAKQALNGVRSHWQVESMHWVLDMTFREDESRISKVQGPLVFNVMRKIAMALLKQDTTKSASMARKKKMAGLDDDYRSTLLESGIKCASRVYSGVLPRKYFDFFEINDYPSEAFLEY